MLNKYTAEGQGEAPEEKATCPLSLPMTLLTVMDSDCHCRQEVTVGEPFTLCASQSSVTAAHIQGPDQEGLNWPKWKKEKMNAQDSLRFVMHLQSLYEIWR